VSKCTEKTRWRIAVAMNKLPRQCWADLVSWALGGRDKTPWRPIGQGCHKDLAQNGRCYCGKLQRDNAQ
jgi:hypothetical protein